MLSLLLAALPVAAVYLTASDEYESGALGPSPVQTFHSSNSTPVLFNFNVLPKRDKRSSDALFFAPWGGDVAKPGPYIFDPFGELIWDGTLYGYGQAMTFTPVVYQGETVIALWDGQFSPGGYGNGHGLLLDSSYAVIANISSTIPNAGVDFHEFTITPEGTALISVYATEPYDVTPWGVPEGNSSDTIMLCYAQEIDIATGKALFTWRSLDHVDPHECYASPQQTSTTPTLAWDYFHINSVDKDEHGNYLLSSRHCHAVYYVSGEDGSIIWTLGGKKSTIELGDGVAFEWQHFARFHENSTISLFDNGGAVLGPNRVPVNDKDSSRGIVVGLDHERHTSTLLYEAFPYHRNVSGSQGNMVLTDEGTGLIGWGAKPFLSEHAGMAGWGSGKGKGKGNGKSGKGKGKGKSDKGKSGKSDKDKCKSKPGKWNHDDCKSAKCKSKGQNKHDSDSDSDSSDPASDMEPGTILWSAQFGVGDVQSYRLTRAEWHARPAYPSTRPALALVRTRGNLDAYMSWNGATDIDAWEVVIPDGGRGGKGRRVGTYKRTGFETRARIPRKLAGAGTRFVARALCGREVFESEVVVADEGSGSAVDGAASASASASVSADDAGSASAMSAASTKSS